MEKEVIEENEFKDENITDFVEERKEYLDKNSKINFIIPEGFDIDLETGSIYKLTKDGFERVCKNPILITGVIKNLDDSTEKLKIEVVKNGEVKEGIFSKSTIYSNPITLAEFGAGVNSSNSRDIIKYLSRLEEENEDRIPIIKAVSKLGWRDKLFVPFSKDSDIVVDLDYKLDKWLKAYSSKGTLKEWIENIKQFRTNYIFRFMMSASFAAPLLKIIAHRIFIVFNWGNSRAGKTACLKSALSVWGNPEDLTLTFNTTAVGIERLARIV